MSFHDDAVDERQLVSVLEARKPLRAHNAVNLLLRFGFNLWELHHG